MANTIKIKQSATPGAIPLIGDIVLGELAINTADGRLFFKNTDNTIGEISSDVATDGLTDVTVLSTEAGQTLISNATFDYVPQHLQYIGTKVVATTSWTVTHNLNQQMVTIVVYDDNNNLIVPDNIVLTDANTATLTFATLTKGTVVIIGTSGLVNTPAPPPGLLAIAVPVNFSSTCSITCSGGHWEVDWGGGSYTQYNSGSAGSGVPVGDITVRNQSGQIVTQIEFTSNTYSNIDIIDGLSLTSMENLCKNLTSLTTFNATNTGFVTNFFGAWDGCSGLTSFPLIDISSATTLFNTWEDCSGLTSFPLLDTSSSTNFAGTWNGCTGLTSFPNLVIGPNNTSVGGAWDGCSGLTSFPLLDFSNVSYFGSAWYGCTGLLTFPAIDASSGTVMSSAWGSCSGLTSFPLILSGNCNDFSFAWQYCSGLTSFALIDTGFGEDFEQTWSGCSSLTSFPALDTSSGTIFNLSWMHCTSLTSFPVIDLSSTTDISRAWHNCDSLTSFPLLDTAHILKFDYTWRECSGLTSFPLIDTSSGLDFDYAWLDCTGLLSFPAINTVSGTSFTAAWQNCSSLTTFPALDFNGVGSMYQTWKFCTNLTSMPAIDTSTVTNFASMFQYCTNLTCISNIDTTAGTSKGDMFGSCPALTQPDAAAQTDITDADGAIWVNARSCPVTLLATAVPVNFSSSCGIYCTGGDYEVDWGNGTFVQYASGITAVVVPTADITVQNQSGSTITQIKFTTDSYAEIDMSISSTLTSMYQLCRNLDKMTLFNVADTSSVLSFASAWTNCSGLLSFPLVDSSACTNFSWAWANCDFTSFSFIDTSKGTNFYGAWSGCNQLTSFPLIDTSKGTTFRNAWINCSGLTSFPLLDTGLGEDFSWAWSGCFGLTAFPLLDVSSGLLFEETWRYCDFTSFPALDTSSGTDFESAWQDCDLLTSFPALDMRSGLNFTDTWNNCDHVVTFGACDTRAGTNFDYAWKFCNRMTSFPTIDVSKGLSFLETWDACFALTSFPVLDTGLGTQFSAAWRQCYGLTSFPLIDTSSGTNFTSTWQNCNQLTSFPAIDTANATIFNLAWRDCTGLTEFPLLDTSKGSFFQSTWYNCNQLTSFPSIDTSSGTQFSVAWLGCSGLTEFPYIDTSSAIQSLDNTWDGCSSLTSFPAIDLSGPTTFRYTWQNCTSMVTMPILNTSNGSTFDQTFRNCTSLTCLTSIDTSKAAATKSLVFWNTPLLTQPDATAQTDISDVDGAVWVNAGFCQVPGYATYTQSLSPVAYWRLGDTVPVSINDDFTGTNGDAPDTELWTVSEPGMVAIQVNALHVDNGGVEADPKVTSKFHIQGDFDVQVDFDNLFLAGSSTLSDYFGLYINFYDSIGDIVHWCRIDRNNSTDELNLYEAKDSGLLTKYANSSTIGKFRITRVGSVIKGYVWENSQWEWDGNTNGYTFTVTDTLEANVYLWGLARAGHLIQIDWDNFILNSGTIVNPTAVDETGTYPGTYLNAPTLETTGLLVNDADTSVSFDGVDDYIDITDALQALGSTGSVSFLCTFPVGGKCSVIGAKTDTTDEYIQFSAAEDGVAFAYKFTAAVPGLDNFSIRTTANLTANTTYHIVVVQDDTEGALCYINGVLSSTTVLSGTANGKWFSDNTPLNTLDINAIVRATPLYYEGTTDEVFITNDKLTQSEITKLYELTV